MSSNTEIANMPNIEIIENVNSCLSNIIIIFKQYEDIVDFVNQIDNVILNNNLWFWFKSFLNDFYLEKFIIGNNIQFPVCVFIEEEDINYLNPFGSTQCRSVIGEPIFDDDILLMNQFLNSFKYYSLTDIDGFKMTVSLPSKRKNG